MSATKPPITLAAILDQFREDKRTNRDLGDRFERLMVRFFELDPIYADRFSEVWMWNDWPKKGSVGDVGIDLVAEEARDGRILRDPVQILPAGTHALERGHRFVLHRRRPRSVYLLHHRLDDRQMGQERRGCAQPDQARSPASAFTISNNSPIDWSKFDAHRPDKLALRAKKQLREHQKAALKDVTERAGGGRSRQAHHGLRHGQDLHGPAHRRGYGAGRARAVSGAVAVAAFADRCANGRPSPPTRSTASPSAPTSNIGKTRKKADDDGGDITIHDLAFPATTNAKQLVLQYDALKKLAKKDKPARMTVVFSTYQSIEAVSKAQKAGLPEFDLIICDEAHRTTGVTLDRRGREPVRQGPRRRSFSRASKRLYMTATPRIYGDEAKIKAKQADAELARWTIPRVRRGTAPARFRRGGRQEPAFRLQSAGAGGG